MSNSPFGRTASLLAILLLTASGSARSQTTLSLGIDYSEGKYGDPDVSTTWTESLVLKHETGLWTLKLNLPYVRSSGTAAAGGDRAVAVKEVQSGFGDIVASAFYTAYYDGDAGLGVDIGGKIKFATADKSKELLTTGKNDYSLQLDPYLRVGDTTWFGSLGRTAKGEPDGSHFRDPWYTSVGFSNKLSAATSWGLTYDYRQRLTPHGDPISEATLFLTHKYSDDLKVQGYLVRGFSEASPDLGVGAMFGIGF